MGRSDRDEGKMAHDTRLHANVTVVSPACGTLGPGRRFLLGTMRCLDRLRSSRDWLRAGRAARRDPDTRGRLAVDEHYRTAVPGTYAVGDMIGFPALASISIEQGRLATYHAFGVKTQSVTSAFLPTSTRSRKSRWSARTKRADRGRHPVRNRQGLLQGDRSRSDYPTLAECYKVASFDGINRLSVFEPDPVEIPQTG